jgi:hypothetical protein
VPVPQPAPSADICAIAPNSALCQVLSPPTASEPFKPVQQASNEVIKTVSASAPVYVAPTPFLDSKKTASDTVASTAGTTSTGTSGGGASSTGGPAATSSTPDDSKAEKKSDTKEVASTEKSGTKNEPIKKTFCN